MTTHDDPRAALELSPQLYQQLRGIAHRYLYNRPHGDTLGTTALVHEAYLRIARTPPDDATLRPVLLAVAARAIRSVLVDHARRRSAAKRSADGRRVPLDDILDYYQQRSIDVIALSDALDRLAGHDDRSSQIINLRFFGGLTFEEIAPVLGVSERTVRRDWRAARAWLRDAIGRSEDDVERTMDAS
jgi:RNA polymerase sigma-70 factor (ECF subfamily)